MTLRDGNPELRRDVFSPCPHHRCREAECQIRSRRRYPCCPPSIRSRRQEGKPGVDLSSFFAAAWSKMPSRENATPIGIVAANPEIADFVGCEGLHCNNSFHSNDWLVHQRCRFRLLPRVGCVSDAAHDLYRNEYSRPEHRHDQGVASGMGVTWTRLVLPTAVALPTLPRTLLQAITRRIL